jgi:hypothetical protein
MGLRNTKGNLGVGGVVCPRQGHKVGLGKIFSQQPEGLRSKRLHQNMGTYDQSLSSEFLHGGTNRLGARTPQSRPKNPLLFAISQKFLRRLR